MDPGWTIERDDEAYPELLRQSPDPPSRIYGRGDPNALGEGIAIIGARKATPYGRGLARTLALWSARAGYRVISGAALGCDAEAHLAALDAGGTTIAVMGCGADVAYPRSAADLLNRIAGSGGAVISEYPWQTQPLPWMFRRRNRIIAGLAQAVLVVEAGLPSGTFTTADEALCAGRSVLAVPGSVLSPTSRGANRLIRQGATPVTDVSDLRDELAALLGPARMDSLAAPEGGGVSGDDLLDALAADPMRPDDAARALGIDVVSVARRLGRLELEGRITRYADGRYGPAPSSRTLQ